MIGEAKRSSLPLNWQAAFVCLEISFCGGRAAEGRRNTQSLDLIEGDEENKVMSIVSLVISMPVYLIVRGIIGNSMYFIDKLCSFQYYCGRTK
ncbi:hypothetical protein DI43_08025 [Geobacillus sp. CAMR12739]|nr:hypothetical protein DI43_08025 [Geobacillus sp. CAMR12739]